MPFGNKTKSLSRLASLNKMVLDDEHADFKSKLLADPVLVQLNQDMVTILGAIRTKFVGAAGAGNIQRPPTVPVPKRRWFGELVMDSTTPGVKNGKKVYVYDHKSAMALNAQAFRDRVDNILKVESQQNDLTDSPNKPNPGGKIGDHPEN